MTDRSAAADIPDPSAGATERGTGAVLAIGRDIRALRKAKGYTLADLAHRVGLSVSYLSQIERDLSFPSVKALHEIAHGLDVTIGWFFGGPNLAPVEERDCIVRANRRRQINFSSGITDLLLTPDLSGQIELLRCTFEPGSTSGDEPYEHEGEEAGVVIQGQFALWLDGQKFSLNEGDSFRFPSRTPHAYSNPGHVETIVIWAITPPSY